MESIQNKALYRIAGAFKTTSGMPTRAPIITLTRTAEKNTLLSVQTNSASGPGFLAPWPPLHRVTDWTGDLAAVSKRYTRLWSALGGDPSRRLPTKMPFPM
jgi:hypothetical protein